AWNGKLPAISDGSATVQVSAVVWQGGAQRLLLAPVRIDGAAGDATGNPKTHLIIEEGRGTASSILEVESGLFGVYPLKDYAGQTLEFAIRDTAFAAWTFTPELTVPRGGALTVRGTSAAAGDYDLVTTITDVGGNAATKKDELHVAAPF